MKFLCFILILGICGCTSGVDYKNSQIDNLNVRIENGNLIYNGSISETANKIIFRAFKDAESKPNRLVISSTGGDIEAGIALGQWVKQNNLDVEVSNICASSCANYVFPAAKTKYLRKDSILLWHGSAWQSWDVEEKLRSSHLDYISSIRERETTFFTKIKVDNLLCIYGQTKITIWDKLLIILGLGSQGYDYSLSDMEKFGMSNITLIDKVWDWRRYRPEHASLVKRIHVDDDFEFKLTRFEI